MSKKSIMTTLVLVSCVAALILGGVALAKKPTPDPTLPRACPWSQIQCPDVWDPVTCDNGVTYSNACYAFRACATGE